MAIITLQRRLHEAGRIRLGEQVATSSGKTRPGKLSTFRFTSPSESAIRAIAQLYGGEPKPWTDAPTGRQWELHAQASEIECHVLPEAMAFSQFYELWSGGGCTRRCDGELMQPSETPCACDPEARECKPTTRLSVLLDNVPGTGQFRLETHGYYAASELSGSFELMARIADATGQSILPATLRIDQREVKRPGEPTRQFIVPVLDFRVNLLALGRGPATDVRMIPHGNVTPVPALPQQSIREQVEQIANPPDARRRSNAAAPLPATGKKPRTAIEAAKAATSEAKPDHITDAQQRKLHAALNDIGITGRKDRLRLASLVAGRDIASSSDLNKQEAARLIDALESGQWREIDPALAELVDGTDDGEAS